MHDKLRHLHDPRTIWKQKKNSNFEGNLQISETKYKKEQIFKRNPSQITLNYLSTMLNLHKFNIKSYRKINNKILTKINLKDYYKSLIKRKNSNNIIPETNILI